MGKEARQKAKEFSWEKIAHQMIPLYTTLMEERNSRINPLRRPAKITRDRISVGISP
jgi:hypothetical protein